LSKKWDFHIDLLGRRDARELTIGVNSDDPQGGKVYGFGLINISYLYRFKAQYFLESTALFRYKLNERHAIAGGIGAKYLYSVKSDIIQKTEGKELNFADYKVIFTNEEEVIESGWWEKESTQDLLPFVQLRYDYRTTRNASLFFKLNAEYNRTWYPIIDGEPRFRDRHFQLETSFGFNYQF